MRLFPLLALLLLAAAPSFAQRKLEYVVAYDATLTSTARILTVQIPAENPRFVLPYLVSVYCEAVCTVNVERDGSTASGNAVTVQKLNPNASWVPDPTAVAFSASTSSGGANVGGAPFVVAAGEEKVLNMTPQVLEAKAAGVRNLTVRIASFTGRSITRVFQEERVNWP